MGTWEGFDQLKGIQSVHNTAVTWWRERTHNTTALRELRVAFKLVTFMFKTLHCQTPPVYQMNASWCLMFIQHTMLCRGPNLGWVTSHNLLSLCRSLFLEHERLTPPLRLIDNHVHFKRLLKEHFVWLRQRRLVTVLFSGAVYEILLTYLKLIEGAMTLFVNSIYCKWLLISIVRLSLIVSEIATY